MPARAQEPSDLDAAVRRDFPGWEVFARETGDLDGDGVDDDAAILFRPGKGEEPGRALLAVYRGAKTGLPSLLVKADKAICVGCGGVKAAFDQPLGELSIARGVL